MTASDVVRRISWDLNDQEPGHEYARWTYSTLASYLQEAVNQVSLYVSDEFQSRVVVELVPGDAWQTVCDDCDRITRILGECTADGSRILRRLRRLTDDERFTWTGTIPKDCPDNDTLNGYMLSSTDSRLFRVVAPVSPADRKTHYVLVECRAVPDVSSDADIPDEVVVLVVQWTLWRALSLDSENNPTTLQLAQMHLQEFHALLNLEIQRKQLEEARNGGVRPVPDKASE